MKISLLSFLHALVAVHGIELHLRGNSDLEQFSCSIEGAGGEQACDASKSDDGSPCVWCELPSFGLCVSEDQADAMKKAIPGLNCDDSHDDDDDDDNVEDDDVAPEDDDDATPDDYWNCLKDYSDSGSCAQAGCAWCDTKAGYGICMDVEAAKSASKSDWFDCSFEFGMTSLQDPYDTSCLAASLQGDEDACVATVDADGEACEWCLVSSVNLCLNAEQAEIAEQVGGSCDSQAEVKDPLDTTCLVASVQGKSGCDDAVDADGKPCVFCSMSSVDLCLNEEQSEALSQFGGVCASTVSAQ